MADDEDEKIVKLGVQFKSPPKEDDRLLEVVHFEGCNHKWHLVSAAGSFGGRMVEVKYLIREGETEVECGSCHVRLDPVWVLKQLAGRESKYAEGRRIYQEEMERLSGRQRTQCDNCGKMTRISRAKPHPLKVQG